MVDDTKHRTKVWLVAWINNNNLTTDDGSSNVKFIVCYDRPTAYPVNLVFLYPKNVDLIFSVSDPISKPDYNGDKSIYGYTEEIPITVSAIDKIGITGVKLKWQAEAELRSLCENHAFGSLRLMDTRKDTSEMVGVTKIWNTEFTLTYRRTTAA